MAVYNKNGALLTQIFNKSGVELSSAYDANGIEVYSKSSSSLKVMTYNVGQWYIGDMNPVPITKKSEYYTLQNGIFDRHRPQLLFIQEYLNNWCADGSTASSLLDPYITDQEATNPTGYIGHSICTNGFEIQNYTSHQFPTNKGNYPTYETAQILYEGKTINIINTHNDYYAQYQQSEIPTLLSAIANMEYFILCGDFNINLTSEDTSDDQYTINVKPFIDAGYHVGNLAIDWIPTYFGTSSPTGGKYCDQIITSPNINISRLYADTTKLSDGISDKIDHIPLIAELVIL
jgi:endonuclease/exonuclease/phosphatase family metal-dependent hydrolase